MEDSVLGVCYAALFILLAAKRPQVAFVLCFSLAPIQRALPSLPFKLTLSDLNLILLLIVFAIQRLGSGRSIQMGPMGFSIALYLLICLLSSIEDFRGVSTFVAFAQMIPYLLIAVPVFFGFGNCIEDLKPAFYGLVILGTFFGVSVIVAGSGYIYGIHKNGTGSSLACVLVLTTELWLSASNTTKKRLLFMCIAIVLSGLLITLSRGAWMGSAAGIVVLLLVRGRARAASRVVAILVPLVILCWYFLPDESKTFATGFERGRANIDSRIAFIETATEQFQKDPILGMGVGIRKDYDATNIMLTTLAETGIVGLVAFLLIYASMFKMVWTARARLPVDGFAFSCLAVGSALMVVKLVHGCVDHYWSRGALLLAWAGAGFATRAYALSQQSRARPPAQIAPRAISRSFPATTDG